MEDAPTARLQAGTLDPALAERVARLRLRARGAVEGLRSGIHQSPHRGASVVFAEHREYRPGDDLRLLDWRAYARSDRHAVKHFEQETHLRAHLILDASSSMRYDGGEAGTDKHEYAAALLGALAVVLLAQGDAPGGYLVGDRLLGSCPPRGRSDQLDTVLGLFASAPSDRVTTDLRASLTAVAERAGRRGLCVLASDLLDLDDGALQPLRLLSARGHDVRVFHVLHPHEISFGFDDAARFLDPESDATIEADPNAVRDAYLAQLRAFLDDCRRRCVAAGARYALCPTDEPLAQIIAESLAGGSWA